jgi:membrane associated rhomboid family serine protease
MTEVPVGTDNATEYLDICTHCHFVWFDPGEYDSLPKAAPKPPTAPELPVAARMALTEARLERMRKDQEREEALDSYPESNRELVLGLFGVPAEYNDTPLTKTPLVTWTLAAVLIAVSVVTYGDLASAIDGWGLIPAELGRHFGLTFLTSFFLHAGVFHLIINVVFLLVFGDNTEDVLGTGRYVLLIALAALLGDALHIAFDPRGTVPCVGASAGTSGILAYYCLRFPQARVGLPVYAHYAWRRWVRLPVRTFFAIWVVGQVVNVWCLSTALSRTAAFTHLGGALAGALFWWHGRELGTSKER